MISVSFKPANKGLTCSFRFIKSRRLTADKLFVVSRFHCRVPVRLLALAMAAVCASRAAVKSAVVSVAWASNVYGGVSDNENTGGIILSVEFSKELKELLPDEAGK
ncbi:hypothetical protein Tco_0903371 [Tanacetum coccineum]